MYEAVNGRPLIEVFAVQDGLDVLNAAITEHKPSRVFALFSGGHDSLAATAITAKHPRFDAAVHVNTGIGVEATREFVRDTCRGQGWPLIEMFPREGQPTYEDLVLKYGFPRGPHGHQLMYRRLKKEKLARLLREQRSQPGERVILASGMRASESVRRMGYANLTDPGWHRVGGQVWTSVIGQWSKADVNRFLESEGLPRNEVVDLMHKSCECMCGAYSRAGEMTELETWFPDMAAYLHGLEHRVEAAGKIGCVWGQAPDNVNWDQGRLFRILPLCSSCEAVA